MEDGSQQQCTIGQCSPWASLESGSGSSKVTWQRGVRTGIGTMCGHSVIYYPQLFQPAVCRKTESQFQTRTDQSRGIQIKAEIKMFQQVCSDQNKLKTSPKAQLLGTPSSGESSSVIQESESTAATSFQRSLPMVY